MLRIEMLMLLMKSRILKTSPIHQWIASESMFRLFHCHCQVNSPFGVRKDPMNKRTQRIHNGLDLKAKFEEVYSMLPGVVTVASYSTNGGYYVTINHGICVCSYLHLSKILVRTGQRVTAGYIIAISGNSGKRTTGPHLHISCRWKNERGKFFNPMLILRFVTEQLLNKE